MERTSEGATLGPRPKNAHKRDPVRRGEFFDGGFPFLKGYADPIPFDIVSQLVPLEPDRVQSLEIGTLTLRVVDFETLARLKLKAGSPKDLWDLAILILMDPARRPSTFDLAASNPELAERLRSYVDDPRAQREALERTRDLPGQRPPQRKKHK